MTSSLLRIKNASELVAQSSGLLVTPQLERWLDTQRGDLVLDPKYARRLAMMLSAQPAVRSGRFSASSRGSCLRAQVFAYLGMPQRTKLDNLEKLRFIDGTMKHLVLGFLMLQAGILNDIEVRVDIPRYRLWGSVDGEGPGWGFELKTTQAFDWFASNGPNLGHKLQVHTYFLARRDWQKFSLLFWDTKTREWKEFIVKRDPAYISMVRDELETLNDSVTHRFLPEVLDECSRKKGEVFKKCPYSHLCLGCRDYDEAEANGAITQSPSASAKRVRIRRRTPQSQQGVRRVVRVRRRPPGSS